MRISDLDNEVTPTLDPGTSKILVRTIFVSALVVVSVGVLRESWTINSGADRLVDSFSLFGGHQNLTSWLQSVLLAISALLWLMFASACSAPARSQLKVGAAVLFYMSIGEHTNFDHEFSMRLMANVVPSEHAYVASLGAASVIAGTLFMILMPAVRRNHRNASLLAVGFAIYVTGAIGFEYVSSLVARTSGVGPIHTLAASTEEVLETLGVAAFAIATIKHLTYHRKGGIPQKLHETGSVGKSVA